MIGAGKKCNRLSILNMLATKNIFFVLGLVRKDLEILAEAKDPIAVQHAILDKLLMEPT